VLGTRINEILDVSTSKILNGDTFNINLTSAIPFLARFLSGIEGYGGTGS
jgi:hypothetical protein